ncbi:Pithd1 [Acrasis kona]|uniref:Pithd1 n=1 Tax=Acrasis kona TaxID=1008807 RepID=A0AAW2YJC0_9EUKA
MSGHNNERTPHSCFNESLEHQHHEGCGHDHDHDNEESGFEQTLYSSIDTGKVTCLNEHTKGAGRNVIKPWNERRDQTKYLESGVDEELILYIPFTVAVKIKSVSIIGGDSESCPSKMKLYKNRDDVDLDSTDQIKSEQDFDVAYDREGTHDYLVKASKFNNVNSLTIFFPSNHSQGEEQTRLIYVGIKGESTTYKRAVVETVYESKPNLSDHEVRADQFVPRTL